MSRSKTSVEHLKVAERSVGQRIDNFLLRHLNGVPRSLIYRVIRRGEVRVNGGRVKPTKRLNMGDTVRVPPIEKSVQSDVIVSSTMKDVLLSSILFEDASLIVLNKPAGIAVHAGSGVAVGVIEGLRQARCELPFLELAHRLDRDTSGCLVIAKKISVLKVLANYFQNNSLKNRQLKKTVPRFASR